jgi:putative hydrolase of the HAD superfamily
VTYAETTRVLQELHRKYRLAVITNGVGEQQRARLALAGLSGYFDVVVASTDIDAGKPDSAVFEHTLGLLGVDPGDTWHIGDSLSADVQGAHNAGLAAAVWLNRNGLPRNEGDPKPHYEVDSLTALPRLLNRH